MTANSLSWLVDAQDFNRVLLLRSYIKPNQKRSVVFEVSRDIGYR